MKWQAHEPGLEIHVSASARDQPAIQLPMQASTSHPVYVYHEDLASKAELIKTDGVSGVSYSLSHLNLFTLLSLCTKPATRPRCRRLSKAPSMHHPCRSSSTCLSPPRYAKSKCGIKQKGEESSALGNARCGIVLKQSVSSARVLRLRDGMLVFRRMLIPAIVYEKCCAA